MKIIYIGQKGIGDISGGVEKHVEALATRLAAKGHMPVVYARRYLYDDKNTLINGVRVIYLPTIPTKHLDTIIHTAIAIIHTFLFQRDAQIIHFHSIGPSSLLGFMRLLKPRTPVIATMHAKCYEHSKWGVWAQTYLKISEWICCNFSQELIVISQDLKDYVKIRYKKTAYYIPNGADSNMSAPKKVIFQWRLQENEYFLFVGRLIPGKKVDLLIAAYNKLETTKKLVIVGGSSHTNRYAQRLLQSARDDEKIIFTGYQNSLTVKALMLYAYTFIFPSESEGMSLVLLEAMAAQVPIIASDIVSNRFLLDDHECVYTPVNDVDALARAMRLSIEQEDYMKGKACNAYQKFIASYAWDLIVNKTLKLYYSIIK